METGMDAYLCRLDQEQAEQQRPEEEEDPGNKEPYCYYCGKRHSKEAGCRFADVNL